MHSSGVRDVAAHVSAHDSAKWVRERLPGTGGDVLRAGMGQPLLHTCGWKGRLRHVRRRILRLTLSMRSFGRCILSGCLVKTNLGTCEGLGFLYVFSKTAADLKHTQVLFFSADMQKFKDALAGST
mmetsp:Transcript_50919/g.128469  ORF Transcript_50919/g.128469 Transcript_50919/m.128469 type:complete len:126 (-) Transcript_50919:104-481(-)